MRAKLSAITTLSAKTTFYRRNPTASVRSFSEGGMTENELRPGRIKNTDIDRN